MYLQCKWKMIKYLDMMFKKSVGGYIHLTELNIHHHHLHIYKDMKIGKKENQPWSGWDIGDIKQYYLPSLFLEEQKDKRWDEQISRFRSLMVMWVQRLFTFSPFEDFQIKKQSNRCYTGIKQYYLHSRGAEGQKMG